MSKIFSHRFIRFGSLSQMKQVNYGKDSFHAPPMKRGIYAFPEGLVDKFLLGATNDPRNPSAKSYWLKDEDGNKITSKEFYNEKNNYDTNSFGGIHEKYRKLIKRKKIKLSSLFEHMGQEDDYEEGTDYVNWYMCVYKKPKIINYTGEIWSHLSLNLKPEHIIKEVGSWVLTSMEDYIMALKIEKHNLRKEMITLFGIGWKDKDPFDHYCTDHLEIFIEKVS